MTGWRLTKVDKAPRSLRWFRVGARNVAEFKPGALTEPAASHAEECHSERTIIRIPLGDWLAADLAVIPYIDDEGEPHALVSAQAVGVSQWTAAIPSHLINEVAKELLTDLDERNERRREAKEAIEEGKAYVDRLNAGQATAAVQGDMAEADRLGREAAIARAQLKGARLVWTLLGMGDAP